ncbi:MAG: tetratricopeptide repeat protein [Acetobacteraceae bacterium]|nr:tetratricopeptide repeat protein [Acetobacteraceae bacterium]
MIESFLANLGGRSHDDAIAQAQDVMYQAWETTNRRQRKALAQKALSISPLCADAYNLLAEEAKTADEAKALYTRGLEAGDLALGPGGFEEYDGHFWGFLETRPYMRARAGLAMTLLRLGEEDAAIEHFRAMLKLNPGDNQGIRYLLLACLLRRDDEEGVKALLSSYGDEWSAQWLYTRALMAYRDGKAADAETLKLVREAWSVNEHVPGILAGNRPPVVSTSSFVTLGGADEATEYVHECGPAWKATPGAVAWLIGLVANLPKKRECGKAAH